MKNKGEEFPLLSVIMCTYNRQNLISESIQSCLDQTLDSWELIIVDDHSTDGTEQVVKAFNDKRIVYVKSTYPKGRSNARNYGLKMCRGKFISFLDSDDLISPNKLEIDVDLLEKNKNSAAVYSSAESKDIYTGKTLGFYNASHYGNLYDLVAYYLPLVIATSQVTIKKEIYQQIGGFDTELDRFEDTDYFRRVSLVTNWISNQEVLVTLKNHTDNKISNQSQEIIIEMIKRYVAKVEDEIKIHKVETKATSKQLYLHYAQAFFVQSDGIRSSLRLYLLLVKEYPNSIPTILISILKMTKHRLLNKLRF